MLRRLDFSLLDWFHLSFLLLVIGLSVVTVFSVFSIGEAKQKAKYEAERIAAVKLQGELNAIIEKKNAELAASAALHVQRLQTDRESVLRAQSGLLADFDARFADAVRLRNGAASSPTSTSGEVESSAGACAASTELRLSEENARDIISLAADADQVVAQYEALRSYVTEVEDQLSDPSLGRSN